MAEAPLLPRRAAVEMAELLVLRLATRALRRWEALEPCVEGVDALLLLLLSLATRGLWPCGVMDLRIEGVGSLLVLSLATRALRRCGALELRIDGSLKQHWSVASRHWPSPAGASLQTKVTVLAGKGKALGSHATIVSASR